MTGNHENRLDLYFINLNVHVITICGEIRCQKLKIMLENPKLHIQPWRLSWIIDKVNKNNFERVPQSIWNKFGFIPSSSFEEDFQRFPIFQPIRSHGSHLGCRTRSPDTKGVSHLSLVQFDPVILEKTFKMWKVNRFWMPSDGYWAFWLWWAKNICDYTSQTNQTSIS